MLFAVSLALATTPADDCPCEDASVEVSTRRPPTTPVSVGVLGGTDLFRADGPSAAGIGAALSMRANEVLAVEFTGVAWPSFERRDFHQQVVELDPNSGVVREITRPVATGNALLVFTPIRGVLYPSGARTGIALDGGIGFGAIYTVDDLAALQAEQDEIAVKTARQLHPTLSWATGPRVSVSERTTFTVRLRGQHWVETFESLNLERLSRVDLTAGVRLRI